MRKTLVLGLLAWSLSGCEAQRPTPAPAPAVTSAAPKPEPTPAPAPAPVVEEAPPESVACQHVLVAWRGAKRAPREVTRSKAEAKRLADEVATKARGGGDFSELVAKYSDDPGSKNSRGNLGKFKREAMVPQFSQAAFALQVGQISDPVETPFGFHVIKRNQ
jgi:hypothetical protein